MKRRMEIDRKETRKIGGKAWATGAHGVVNFLSVVDF